MGAKLTQLSQITIATAGTAQALAASAGTRTPSIVITADPSNVGDIYVGDASVDGDNAAIILEAGDTAVIDGKTLGGNGDYIDLSNVYLDASISGEKVRAGYIADA